MPLRHRFWRTLVSHKRFQKISVQRSKSSIPPSAPIPQYLYQHDIQDAPIAFSSFFVAIFAKNRCYFLHVPITKSAHLFYIPVSSLAMLSQDSDTYTNITCQQQYQNSLL